MTITDQIQQSSPYVVHDQGATHTVGRIPGTLHRVD